MSLIGDITGLGGVATAADGITKSITDLIGKFIPDPNVRAQAEVEAKKIAEEGAKAQWDAMSAVMVADSHSDSAYTRAARPTVVYWSLGMITLIALASLFGAADPIVVALAKAPDQLWTTIQYGVGIYTAGRSTEKVAGVAASVIKAVVARRK